jgi:putative membrane protein
MKRDYRMFRTFGRCGVALALLLAGGAARAADTSETATVLGKLHHSNQMEIDMGKLAQEKGMSKEVKSYGKTLVTDHTAADKKVTALAKQEKIELTATMPPMAGDKMAQLKTATGAEFDKAFARDMLEDHTKDVDEAKAARDKTTDPKLKSLLTSTIPVLEKHREIAQKLVDTLGSSKAGAAGANMPEQRQQQ